MGANGDGRRAAPASAQEAWVEAAAAALFQTLHQLYPLEDPQKLAKIAMGTAREQVKLQAVAQQYVAKEHTHVEFHLLKPKRIITHGQKHDALKVIAPLRLENCTSLQEAINCIAVFSIISSPLAQALFALHGYKIQVGVGSARPQAKSEEPTPEKKD